MKTLIRATALAAALFIGSTTVGAAQAVNACYVPAVGAIYLIGLPGLPAGCLAAHTAVSLSSGGASAPADGSVSTAKLQDGAVITSKIADGAVTGLKLGPNSVGAAHIAAGSIGTVQLATGAVTASDIAASAVGAGHIGPDAVGSSQIAANAVGSSEIANGAVTAAKLAPGAVSLQHTTVFTPLTSVPASGSEFSYSVDCPSGYLPMAGVFNKDSYALQITFSRPTATGWSFRVHNIGATTRALFMGVYCIRLS